MNILHVTLNASCRSFKLMKVLEGAGHECTLLAGATSQWDLASEFSRVMIGKFTPSMIAAQVDAADVVIAHTSINACQLIDLIKDCPSRKLIIDANDTSDDLPKLAGRAACVIASSSGHARIFDQYGIGKATLCVRSKVPAAWWPSRCPPVPKTVGLATGLGTDQYFRDYRQVMEMVPNLFVHSAKSAVEPCFLSGGNVLMPVGYHELLKAFRRYSWGWAGAANDRHEIDACCTNKFWESLACGVPVITWRSAEMTKIARDLRVGVEWEGKIPASLYADQCRYAIEACRDKLTMESEIPAINTALELATTGKG